MRPSHQRALMLLMLLGTACLTAGLSVAPSNVLAQSGGASALYGQNTSDPRARLPSAEQQLNENRTRQLNDLHTRQLNERLDRMRRQEFQQMLGTPCANGVAPPCKSHY